MAGARVNARHVEPPARNQELRPRPALEIGADHPYRAPGAPGDLPPTPRDRQKSDPNLETSQKGTGANGALYLCFT